MVQTQKLFPLLLFKSWKYLGKVVPNSKIPLIGDYAQIVAALCNTYRPTLCPNKPDDRALAQRMLQLVATEHNPLQDYVNTTSFKTTVSSWKKFDAEDAILDFPQ